MGAEDLVWSVGLSSWVVSDNVSCEGDSVSIGLAVCGDV